MMTENSTEQMAELYQKGWTLEEIGQKFRLTRQGVRHRLVREGVEIRPRKYQRIDKAILKKLYSDEKLSIAKIAKFCRFQKTLSINLWIFTELGKFPHLDTVGEFKKRTKDSSF